MLKKLFKEEDYNTDRLNNAIRFYVKNMSYGKSSAFTTGMIIYNILFPSKPIPKNMISKNILNHVDLWWVQDIEKYILSILKQKKQGGAGFNKAIGLIDFLIKNGKISGKLISAIWDPWDKKNFIKKLNDN